MRRAVVAVVAGAVLFGTAAKCDTSTSTAHPKLGDSCSRPGRVSQTDEGVRVVCKSAGGDSGGELRWRRR